jgi:hypothetical protein
MRTFFSFLQDMSNFIDYGRIQELYEALPMPQSNNLDDIRAPPNTPVATYGSIQDENGGSTTAANSERIGNPNHTEYADVMQSMRNIIEDMERSHGAGTSEPQLLARGMSRTFVQRPDDQILAIDVLREIRPTTRLLEVGGWLQHYRDHPVELEEESFDSDSTSDTGQIFDIDHRSHDQEWGPADHTTLTRLPVGLYDPWNPQLPQTELEIEYVREAFAFIRDSLQTSRDWDIMTDEVCDPFIGCGSQGYRTGRWFWGLQYDQRVEVCLQRKVGLRPGTKWILGPHDDQLPQWEMRWERNQCRIAPVHNSEIYTGYTEAWRHISRRVFTVPGVDILRRLANGA